MDKIKTLLIILIIEILLFGILADKKIDKVYKNSISDIKTILMEHEARG